MRKNYNKNNMLLNFHKDFNDIRYDIYFVVIQPSHVSVLLVVFQQWQACLAVIYSFPLHCKYCFPKMNGPVN